MRCCCFRYDYESLSKTCLRCRCVCVCEWGWGSVSVRAMPVCVSTMPWCGCEYDGRYEKGRSAFSLVEAAAKWANMSVMNYVFALYINKPSLAHTHTVSCSLLGLVAFSYWCARWLSSPHPLAIEPITPFSTSFPHFFLLAVFLSPLNTYYFSYSSRFLHFIGALIRFRSLPKIYDSPCPTPLSHPPTWKQRRRRKQHY